MNDKDPCYPARRQEPDENAEAMRGTVSAPNAAVMMMVYAGPGQMVPGGSPFDGGAFKEFRLAAPASDGRKIVGYCSECGVPLYARCKFCPECGAPQRFLK